MKGHFAKALLCAIALSAAAPGLIGTAEAAKHCKGRACRQAPYAGEPGVYRYVVAEATIGGRTVAGPVRAGQWGDEVRTPGGNWYKCEVTCEYTLRRLTVDFWDNFASGGGLVTPGYFRFDLDLDTGRVTRNGPPLFGRY
jgi:hypothetical protein